MQTKFDVGDKVMTENNKVGVVKGIQVGNEENYNVKVGNRSLVFAAEDLSEYDEDIMKLNELIEKVKSGKAEINDIMTDEVDLDKYVTFKIVEDTLPDKFKFQIYSKGIIYTAKKIGCKEYRISWENKGAKHSTLYDKEEIKDSIKNHGWTIISKEEK